MNREILRLAIPNIISNISVPLLSAVDTALMGHLSAIHLGAVGLGSMIFNFIYWNFGFLRMGTTGTVAQQYGGDDRRAVFMSLVRGGLLALVIASALMAFSPFLLRGMASLLQVSAEHRPLVREYFQVRIWAAPATMIMYVFLGWYFGVQNSLFPMIITVIINVSNIVLSYYFVRVLDLGIAGVAWGTVIAEYIGVLVAISLMLYRYRSYLYGLAWRSKNLFDGLDDFFSVNANLFIRTVALTGAFLMFYRLSSEEGAIVLAANVVLLQLLNWLSYTVDGFAFAAESVVGKYYGAKSYDKVVEAVNKVIKWGTALAVVYAMVYFAFTEALISLFTSDEEVISFAMRYRCVIAALPIVAYLCYVWDGIYIGLTESIWMRNTMVISAVVFIVFHMVFFRDITNGIWYSFFIFLGFRSLLQTIIWRNIIATKLLKYLSK